MSPLQPRLDAIVEGIPANVSTPCAPETNLGPNHSSSKLGLKFRNVKAVAGGQLRGHRRVKYIGVT